MLPPILLSEITFITLVHVVNHDLGKSKRYERDNFLKLLFLSYLFFWRYQRLLQGKDCEVIRPNLAALLCFLMQGKANSSCRIFCRASFGRNENKMKLERKYLCA